MPIPANRRTFQAFRKTNVPFFVEFMSYPDPGMMKFHSLFRNLRRRVLLTICRSAGPVLRLCERRDPGLSDLCPT